MNGTTHAPIAVLLMTLTFFGCSGGTEPQAALQTSTSMETAVDSIENLESSIPVLMARARIPGLQIAVIRDRELAWEAGFGVVDSEGRGEVTTETVFEAASLTKPLFAYAVMKMVDRGEIDLDRPIVDRLPAEDLEVFLGHPTDEDGYDRDLMRRITPRHVLSHSAGMAHGNRTNLYTFAFEPGSDWKYSSDGYRMLQLLVEEIQGRPLDEVVDSLVLDPLGMSHSSMIWRDGFEAVMAHGHDLFGSPAAIRKHDQPTSSASLYTTAGDYARFVLAVMKGRDLEGATAREMLEWTIDMDDDGDVGWSLGFGLQRHSDDLAFWQWGDYDIFRSYVIASRERGDAVVYLTNSFNGLAICNSLVLSAFGEPAMGCLELEYQPADGLFYEFFWAVEDEGASSVAPRLPDLVASNPDFFTDERISGIGEILEGVGQLEAAAECSRFNLREHPESGEMMLRAAWSELVLGNFEVAGLLIASSVDAADEPKSLDEVGWLLDYLTAMEKPAELTDARLGFVAGDYGPRHILVQDGGLVYLRDGAGPSAHRPLRAVSSDTFVVEGVPSFKLRVVFDDNGKAAKLMGLYQDGRTDESLRDD